MENLKLSVVIPCFNAAKYLPATLNSIRKQNYQNIEVIVVDGGSRDGTDSVVKSYADIVSVFISEPDQGQLGALQKGLRVATGDVIHWLNADDIMMPGAIRCVVEILDSRPEVDLVYSDDFAFDEEKRVLSVGQTIKKMTYKDHVLFYRQMYSECVYWRASRTKYLPPDYNDLRVYTDYAFFVNLREGLVEHWVPKRLGAFRQRADQNSRTNEAIKQTEFIRIRSDIYRTLGWSSATVRRKKVLHATSFFIRQFLYPQAERSLRRTIRWLTNDQKRRTMSALFFDNWLQCENHSSKVLEVTLRR